MSAFDDGGACLKKNNFHCSAHDLKTHSYFIFKNLQKKNTNGKRTKQTPHHIIGDKGIICARFEGRRKTIEEVDQVSI